METGNTPVQPSDTPSPQAGDGRLVSAVVPVYNGDAGLREFHARLGKALDGTGRPWEIVYVDDGSQDQSLEILVSFTASDPRVRVVELNRTWGRDAAVAAGLAESRGEVVVTLDAGLRDAPDEVPRLVAKIEEGYDVVGTRRRGRKAPFFRRLAFRLAGRRPGGGTTDSGCVLRAYHRVVVDPIVRRPELPGFVPVLANEFARKSAELEIESAGRPSDAWTKPASSPLDLLTGLSLAPLRLMTYFGWVVALSAFGLAAYILFKRFRPGGDAWAEFGVLTCFAIVFLMVGALFIATGVQGEYVGRIYAELRQRPPYAVRKVHRRHP